MIDGGVSSTSCSTSFPWRAGSESLLLPVIRKPYTSPGCRSGNVVVPEYAKPPDGGSQQLTGPSATSEFPATSTPPRRTNQVMPTVTWKNALNPEYSHATGSERAEFEIVLKLHAPLSSSGNWYRNSGSRVTPSDTTVVVP